MSQSNWLADYRIFIYDPVCRETDPFGVDMKDLAEAHRLFKKGTVGTISFRDARGNQLEFRPIPDPLYPEAPLGLWYW